MNKLETLSRRNRWRSLVLASSFFFFIGLATGGTVWWWQNRDREPVALTEDEKSALEERIYEPGAKFFTLTERELNGLLHANTTLGQDLRFELENNAVHARIKITLDEDVPLIGGKTLKAKARFQVSTAQGLVLDDLTVYGISVPNAWLGEIKGENLLASMTGELPRGIKGLTVERGILQVELEE